MRERDKGRATRYNMCQLMGVSYHIEAEVSNERCAAYY